MPIVRIGTGFRLMWEGRRTGPESEGEISPFAALMTCLAATVGTGNIAGVATAIALGGPGALFWMWMTALVGMATKYCEVVLAVEYREVDEKGEHIGGPMYAIKNGLGKKWAWLGTAFAIFGGIAGFGIGNMVQANGIADVHAGLVRRAHWLTGVDPRGPDRSGHPRRHQADRARRRGARADHDRRATSSAHCTS